MGKGRILTAHGAGRYTIELLEDRARANTARALAVSRVADLDARISTRETDYAQAQAMVDAAADELDQAIAAYQAEMQAEGESGIDTTKPAAKLQEAAAYRDGIAADIRALKVQRLAAQRRIDLIDAMPALRQQEAWCADYTEDLEGEVATAEVPGQATHVQLRPGYNGAATYDQVRDGALQPALSGTPAGVFYNLAMLPGWQKWRPTYRIATITSVDTLADTCAITLDAATSSQQDLDVNAQGSYADVPVQYMTCNAAIFEVGDRVLVEFSGDIETPVVVGFEQAPRQCGGFGLLDVEEALLALYPDPLGAGVTVTQENQTNYYKDTAEAGTYVCDISGETFTRVDVTGISTAQAVIPDKDYVISEIERRIPADLTAANASNSLVVVNEIVSCSNVGVVITLDSTPSRGYSSSGWYGYRDDPGGRVFDGDCADGVTDQVIYIDDFTQQRAMSGTIFDAIISVDWERRTSVDLYVDDSYTETTIDQGELDEVTWWFAEDDTVIEPGPADAQVTEDVFVFGGVSVDLLQIDVAAHGGLVYWLPEVALYRGEEGTYGAVVLHEGRSREPGITLRVVGFEFNGTTWQRADVSTFMADYIRNATTRRETINALTDRQYSVFDLTLDLVPASVG